MTSRGSHRQMISYAQNREDVLLDRVFGGKTDGFYVDLGAYDPVEYSVTKHFYDLGWTGINVEPGEAFAALAAARPRDINLNLAVSDRSGSADFFYADPAGSSELVREGELPPQDGRVGTVRTATLNEILDEHAEGRQIDFLKIDIEGGEEAVVRSTDWTRHRPVVLMIEATYPQTNEPAHEGWEPVLIEDGYLFAYFDGINRFYVRKEDAQLLHPFSVPVNVLDDYEVYDAVREERLRQAELERDALAAWISNLTENLRAPDAPRALRMVLPLARMLRAAFGRSAVAGRAHRLIRRLEGLAHRRFLGAPIRLARTNSESPRVPVTPLQRLEERQDALERLVLAALATMDDN